MGVCSLSYQRRSRYTHGGRGCGCVHVLCVFACVVGEGVHVLWVRVACVVGEGVHEGACVHVHARNMRMCVHQVWVTCT